MKNKDNLYNLQQLVKARLNRKLVSPDWVWKKKKSFLGITLRPAGIYSKLFGFPCEIHYVFAEEGEVYELPNVVMYFSNGYTKYQWFERSKEDEAWAFFKDLKIPGQIVEL